MFPSNVVRHSIFQTHKKHIVNYCIKKRNHVSRLRFKTSRIRHRENLRLSRKFCINFAI